MTAPLEWLRAFALTLAIESIVAVPLLAKVESRRWRLVAFVAFANLATHPIVWFVFPELPISTAASLALAEAFAVAVEAALYRLAFEKIDARRALLVSLLANLASFALGWILRALGVL